MRFKQSKAIAVAAVIIVLAVVVGSFAFCDMSEETPWAGVKDKGFWDVKDKRFWDYLDLLVVPAMLLVAGAWISYRLDRRAQEIEDRQVRERELDAELRDYQDQVEQLLCHANPRSVEDTNEARDFAKGHTDALLEDLDGSRKRRLLAFLYESDLIKGPEAIIPLRGADLSGAKLRGAFLKNADLREVNLRSADLRNANLIGANLNRANLDHAALDEAKLDGADLSGTSREATRLSPQQLQSVRAR